MALTVMTSDAAILASANKNEIWHAALKTKGILLGVNNHNTLVWALDLAAR